MGRPLRRPIIDPATVPTKTAKKIKPIVLYTFNCSLKFVARRRRAIITDSIVELAVVCATEGLENETPSSSRSVADKEQSVFRERNTSTAHIGPNMDLHRAETPKMCNSMT
jgi:translation elongation factor EF-Ts